MILRILLPLLLLVGFTACNNDDPNARFTLPVQNLQFTIDAGLSTFDSHYYNLVDVPVQLDSLASFYNLTRSSIESLVPRRASVESIFGNGDYSFMREISVRICSQDESVKLRNGEPEQCDFEIFWRNTIPNDVGNRLDIIPNENDLLQYLEDGRATFQVKLVSPLYRSPNQFIESRLLMEFDAY